MTKSPQDDEDDENYNPFASLFGRISASAKDEKQTDGGSGGGNGDTDTVPDEHVHKRTGQPRPGERPAKIPRAASPDASDEVPPPHVPGATKPGKPQKEKAKRTKKNTDETAEENKRRRQSQGPELVEDDGDVAMTAEDAELLQKFQLLTHDFDDMDPQAKDDASFRQWLKDSQSFQSFFPLFLFLFASPLLTWVCPCIVSGPRGRNDGCQEFALNQDQVCQEEEEQLRASYLWEARGDLSCTQ